MSGDAPRRLGRGLEALISTAKQQREDVQASPGTASSSRTDLKAISIRDISPNRFQPRRVFDDSDLADLEASIRASGLLQPVTVREKAGGGWELVAGERRLRAATKLGWSEIPAIIRTFDDRAMLTLALVENLQRTDLNAIEEAEGYERLISEFNLTQQQVADAVGKDRTTITNLIRVLALPLPVRAMLEQGRITTGHARALLTLRDSRRQSDLANEIVAHHLSVRDVEARARMIADPTKGVQRATRSSSTDAARPANPDPTARHIADQLRRRLQTDVSVQRTAGERGEVRIAFYSNDDLERLLHLILGKPQSDFD